MKVVTHQLRDVRELKSKMSRRVETLDETQHARGSLSAAQQEQRTSAHRVIVGAERYLRAMNARGATLSPDPDAGLRRFAFSEWLRQQGSDDLSVRRAPLAPELRAALNVGTSTQGGVTVPAEFDDEVVLVNSDEAPIEALASFFTSVSHGPLTIAGATVEPTSALLTEGGAYGESEPTFAGFTQNGYKHGHIAKTSDELFHDAGTDLVELVAKVGGRSVQLSIDAAFATGSGTSQPQGLNANTVGYTLPTGNTTSLTYNGLVELFFALKSGYRANASWIMADLTLKAAHELADSAGQPIVKFAADPSLPPTILGRPVYVSQNWPTMAANAVPVYFGDVASNYLVRRIGETQVKVLTEPYGLNDQLGIRLDRRVDGRIVDPMAAVLLKNSAT